MKKKAILLLSLILLITASNAQTPSYVPTGGLKGWWSFTGNANDLSGNNINGTVNGGALLTTDRFGNANSAYLYDGGNDWIDYGDVDLLNPHFSDMTVSAWVKTTSTDSRIFSKGCHGGSQPGYVLMIYPGSGGKAAAIFGAGGHEHIVRSNNPVNDNNWHLITGVINRAGNIELYVDGVKQTATLSISDHSGVNVGASTYNATTGVSYCSFGTPNTLNEFISGKIDEVGVWNRVLTPCEIIRLYNQSSSTSTITTTACASYTAPDGAVYTTSGIKTAIIPNSNGCDSTITINLTVNPLVNYYTDTDGDGFGYGTAIPACTQPANTSLNNTDCDDNNSTMHAMFDFYADSDGDGFGNLYSALVGVCAVDALTPPTGYSLNHTDNCNNLSNPTQLDTDADGLGDACDTDDDNDGVADVVDNCILTANPLQQDNDLDGFGDACDTDDDNDGMLDVTDNCPFASNPSQQNFDGDALGDACDTDDDNDGVADISDCAPFDNTKWQSALLYIDNDNDNYDNGTGTICYGTSIPAGYKASTLGSDCNDNNSAINPGATEICGNGIDDNCNGQIDECYTLTLTNSGTGSGTVTSSPAGINCSTTCSYQFPVGTNVTLTAAADVNSVFSSWTGNLSGITNPQSIVINSNKNINADFSIKKYNFNTTVIGIGSVTSAPAGISCPSTCTSLFDAGTVVTLTAMPQIGSVFIGWSGACSGTGACMVNMTNNKSATANFSCPSVPNTPGTISGATEVCSGTSQTFSVAAVPNTSGYTWILPSGWIGSSVTNSITATTGNSGVISVIANNACGASSSQTMSVTVSTLPTATISYSGTALCPSASVQSVTLTGTSGGVYSSVSGLSLNAATGEITPATSTAGTYSVNYTLAAAGGCPSVIASASITINSNYTFSENKSICNGASYNWQGSNYSTTGNYIATYTTINGCDSIYTLNLTINPTYTFTENQSICSGNVYTWQGANYTTSGNYTSTYTTTNGCDSIYTLNLTVNPVYTFSENKSICNGNSYNWQGADYATTGNYIAAYTTTSGCDSIYTLNLTVNPTYAFLENKSICDGNSYNWQGTDYSVTGNYSASYTTTNGCDSIYTLNLTVNPVYSFTENKSICKGDVYNWQGSNYSIANTYTTSYTSVSGCDSAFTLNLTVNSVDTSVVQISNTLSSNAVSAQYQWLDCNNSFAILNGETAQSFNASSNGGYAVQVTQNLCVDTSSCYQINSVKIKELQRKEVLIYPNPFSDAFTIQLNEKVKSATFEIVNSIGELVQKGILQEKTVIQATELRSGIYLLKLKVDGAIEFRKILKD